MESPKRGCDVGTCVVKRPCVQKPHCDYVLQFGGSPWGQGLRSGPLRSKTAAFCVCVVKPTKVGGLAVVTPRSMCLGGNHTWNCARPHMHEICRWGCRPRNHRTSKRFKSGSSMAFQDQRESSSKRFQCRRFSRSHLRNLGRFLDLHMIILSHWKCLGLKSQVFTSIRRDPWELNAGGGRQQRISLFGAQ